MLAGGGHGWNTPLLVSIPLWVLYPLTLYAHRNDLPHVKAIMWVLAAIAVGSDALLIIGTVDEATYLSAMIRVSGIAGYLIAAAWSALWIGWHVILVRGFVADTADA